MPIFSSTIQDLVANKSPQPYYRFGGSSDKIVTNDPIITGTGDFSFIAWIYKETSTNTDYICGNYGTGNSGGVEFYTVSGGRLTVHNTANVYTTTSIADGVWTQVGLTRISGAITLYLNGVADGTGTLAATIDGDRNFAIGNGPDYTSEDFNGSISDVKVFNKGLSATEVEELYGGASVPFRFKGAGTSNLVTNGTFASDASWTHGGNSSISGGKLVLAGMPIHNATYQEVSNIVLGKMYRITFTVSDFSAGEVMSMIGANQAYGTARTTNGTFTQDWRATFSTTRIGIVSGGTTTAKVDDFSVYHIGAVAEYDGSGISSDKWFDKSGNDYHGTVSGASAENTAGAPTISPNHPAFGAKAPGNQTDLAIAQSTAIEFDEFFDNGDNFASDTFTAPVTGKYLMCYSLYLLNVDTDATAVGATIKTSNRQYETWYATDAFMDHDDYFSVTGSHVCDMDINDTCYMSVYIQSSGSAQMDIHGDSIFTGALIC